MITVKDFAISWEYETVATIKVFESLSETSLKEKFNPHVRTIGALVYHMIDTLGEMGGQAGLPVVENKTKPTSVQEIVQLYKTQAEALLKAVESNWDDKSLLEEIMMYGELWQKGKVLNALIMHQCHHRGQLTVLMRFAGLTVPGVYGPSQEEWSAFGMQAPVE